MKPSKIALLFFYCLASIAVLSVFFSHVWRAHKDYALEKGFVTLAQNRS